MNPLTLVKRIQKINSQEAALGISEDASWHAKYKESAYVFVGGIPFDLTEGDLLAVFAQYGEIVDVNLVRDKGTGKSKGFAFVAYEDQRSTNLAVDNLNGAQILGRIIRVDHVIKYKKKEEEDEETERQKREARGICRAFQKGECNRGAGCKFSHDEQRASNTGWGSEDKSSRWGHDKFQGSTKSDGKPNSTPTNRVHDNTFGEGHRFGNRSKGSDGGRESHHRRSVLSTRDQDGKGLERQMERKEKELNYKEDRDRRATERRSGRYDSNPSEGHDRRGEDQDTRGTERRSRRNDFELKEGDCKEEDQDRRATERRSGRQDSNPSEDHDRRGEDQDDRGTERRSRRHDFESREDDRKEEDWDMRATERKYRKPEFETNTKDEHDGREEKRSRRHELESKPKEDCGRRGEKQSRRHESESYQREDHRDERGDKWSSGHSRDTASHRHRER